MEPELERKQLPAVACRPHWFSPYQKEASGAAMNIAQCNVPVLVVTHLLCRHVCNVSENKCTGLLCPCQGVLATAHRDPTQ